MNQGQNYRAVIIMSSLEEQRHANIARNKAHLQELGILYQAPSPAFASTPRPPPSKRRKVESLPPSRSSTRIASAPIRQSYIEEEDRTPGTSRSSKIKGRAKVKKGAKVRTEPAEESKEVAIVLVENIDSIRAGWTAWTPTAPLPTRDEDMVFHFEDQPSFTPNKSPEEMLRQGCFGGSYFRPLYSKNLGINISNDYNDLPSSWTADLDITRFLTSSDYDPEINKYKVKCGQSIEEWEAAGWISHAHDVRGWFQWYCRFFMGRRCEDDERQVGRWSRCVGPTGRWRRMLLKKYLQMGVREVWDDGEEEETLEVSPVMHQTCHQWGWEIRQGELEKVWRDKL